MINVKIKGQPFDMIMAELAMLITKTTGNRPTSREIVEYALTHTRSGMCEECFEMKLYLACECKRKEGD